MKRLLILVMTFVIPAIVRAEQDRQTEVIKPLDYRQVVISNIKLTIPGIF